MNSLKDDNSNFLLCCPLCGLYGVDLPFILSQCESRENALCNNNNIVHQESHGMFKVPSSGQLQCCSCSDHTWSPAIFPKTKEKDTNVQGSLNSTSDIPHSSFKIYIGRSRKSIPDCKAANFGNRVDQSEASHASGIVDPAHLSCEDCETLDVAKNCSHDKLKLLPHTKYPYPYPSEKEASVYSTCSTVPPDVDLCSQCSDIVNFNCSHGSRTGPGRLRPNLPEVVTSIVEDRSSILDHIDLPARRTSRWKRQAPGLLLNSADNRTKVVPPVKHYPVFPSLPNGNLSADQHSPRSHDASHGQLYMSHAEIFNHNKERNRITTSHTRSSSKSSTTSPKSRPRRTRARDQLHSAAVISGLLRPGFYLSPWPSQVLDDGLYHEGEYLPAEMVYSLHFRNYTIGEVLGMGVSSTVRRVTEKSTGMEYAVKIIDISGEKGELVQMEQLKKDTFREISILRMCAGHPNIIELHDVFETPTFIFLVFEICKKGELFDFLTSVVSLSEKRTRIFMRQLVEAVAYFHDKNIVHRDLKPENILLDDALNIKVSDFGFATVIKDGEELTELCGTPGYLAPEVLAHSMYENVPGYGKEVDMWACGVIMYTLLCGAPPFWNRRQMMMLRSIMAAEYTFNSPEWDDITDAPKDLIRKLLVVNPAKRLTAKEVLLHPFFLVQVVDKKFKAMRKFKAGVRCIVFYLRLNFYSRHPQPISVNMMRDNPYNVKMMRKVIDACAFGMYKHWVKRVDNQNRAALFEHTLRDDWKHSLIVLDGIKA